MASFRKIELTKGPLQPHTEPAIRIGNKAHALTFEGLLDFHNSREMALNGALALLDPSNGGEAYFRGFR